MKKVYLIFYGADGDAAKKRAVEIRAEKATALLRHAEAYRGETELCDGGVILPDVSAHDVARIKAAYGDKVVSQPRSTLPPPPVEIPPPPAPPAVSTRKAR